MYESIRIFHGIERGYVQSHKRLELRSPDLLATILVSYLERDWRRCTNKNRTMVITFTVTAETIIVIIMKR